MCNGEKKIICDVKKTRGGHQLPVGSGSSPMLYFEEKRKNPFRDKLRWSGQKEKDRRTHNAMVIIKPKQNEGRKGVVKSVTASPWPELKMHECSKTPMLAKRETRHDIIP